jgi:early secretory antigenic target protein ESAT-6
VTHDDQVLVVNFAALQHASGEIQNALGRLHSTLGELERDAQPLVSTWDGSAKQAYAQRQAGWRRAAEDLSVMLANIKSALDESAADYLHTEQRNTRLFE